MPHRASKWIIHQVKDNDYDLSRGGRYLYEGMRSEAEALRRLQSYHKPGEPVWLEEKDGYRIDITKRLKKAGIIS